MTAKHIRSSINRFDFIDPEETDKVLLSFSGAFTETQDGMNVSMLKDDETTGETIRFISKSEALHLAAWLVKFYANDSDGDEE